MFASAARQLRQWLTDVEYAVVLNVGSSTAEFFTRQQPYIWQDVLAPLYARGNAVINVDQKAAPGVHLVRPADALALTGFADVILCCNLLEHVVSPAAVLTSIATALKPGGRLLIDGPVDYPYHADPIDNGLRPQSPAEWDALVGDAFVRQRFALCTHTSPGVSACLDYVKRSSPDPV
jgi:SAM-dependent methyltransferase